MVAKNNDFLTLYGSAFVKAFVLHRKQEPVMGIFHYHRPVHQHSILDLLNKTIFFHAHKQNFRNEAEI